MVGRRDGRRADDRFLACPDETRRRQTGGRLPILPATREPLRGFDLGQSWIIRSLPKASLSNETPSTRLREEATVPPEPPSMRSWSGGEVGRGGGPACSASSTATGGREESWGSLGLAGGASPRGLFPVTDSKWDA